MIANYHLITDDELKYIKDKTDVYEFFAEKQIEDSPMYCCVYKLWHALEYLMTESSTGENVPPYSGITLGGEVFGDDFGYGQPRYYPKWDTKGINKGLQKLDRAWFDKQFLKLYKTFNEKEIYPGNWSDNPLDEKEGLWEFFNHLQKFWDKCDKEKLNMIAYYD